MHGRTATEGEGGPDNRPVSWIPDRGGSQARNPAQAKSLRFNWRVIQAPMRQVDYDRPRGRAWIHRDHTKASWARLAAVVWLLTA